MVTRKKRPGAGESVRRPIRRGLSRKQNYLFTRLERTATPIENARWAAVEGLHLEPMYYALERELILKRPRLPDEDGSEFADVERRWALFLRQLDNWILENLKSGKLLAFGMPLPLTPSTVALPITTALWRMLELDVDEGTAKSERWSYNELRVTFPYLMSEEARDLIDDGLWLLGTVLTEELFRDLRSSRGSRTSVERADAPEAQKSAQSSTTRTPSELPSARRLKALSLLRKSDKAKYQSIKLAAIVEQMIERAELGIMADTFEAEKKALREWLRAQPTPKILGKRKNEGQLPKPSTFDKNINSLRPIYQELLESMRSKFAANSEVIA